ncbi:hypothetical protein ACMYR3_03700 [Ampullimonas aquatilis]|uniref:hypothetical protein n=1 Tax=Ampullimonas aquatilis TaxID=1341549 RepID=UPI003C77025C
MTALSQPSNSFMGRMNYAVRCACEYSGLVGLTLLVFLLIGLAMLTWLPLETEKNTHQLRGKIEHLSEQLLKEKSASQEVGQPVLTPMESFYSGFRYTHDVPEVMKQMLELSKKNNVQIESADFKVVKDVDSRLLRYQMQIPVKSNYQNFRVFLNQLMKDVPYLALNETSFKRDTSKDDQLEIRLIVDLYFLAD